MIETPTQPPSGDRFRDLYQEGVAAGLITPPAMPSPQFVEPGDELARHRRAGGHRSQRRILLVAAAVLAVAATVVLSQVGSRGGLDSETVTPTGEPAATGLDRSTTQAATSPPSSALTPPTLEPLALMDLRPIDVEAVTPFDKGHIGHGWMFLDGNPVRHEMVLFCGPSLRGAGSHYSAATYELGPGWSRFAGQIGYSDRSAEGQTVTMRVEDADTGQILVERPLTSGDFAPFDVELEGAERVKISCIGDTGAWVGLLDGMFT